MANVIPMRFKRITEAFDDDARARLCQSSSRSDHSANSVTDLSDLVDSFFEENTNNINRGDCFDDKETSLERLHDDDDDDNVGSFFGTDLDTKEMLADLLQDGQDCELDRRVIVNEVDVICQNMEGLLDQGFKRPLMTMLRNRGFDAGLCKSRWEKTLRHPAGEYEYIDIVISNNRYIVEVLLGSEFTIARPTKTYQSLLDMLPKITVIKPNELKKVVRLMCAAMRASLKTRDMLVSPWRKNGYMQKKWFSSFKRTTNALLVRSAPVSAGHANDRTGESFLGFEFSPVVGGGGKNYCRKGVGRMHVVSNLKTLMLSGMS